MPSVHGHTGFTGNPSDLPPDLSKYGIRGKGSFRIEPGDGSSPETWLWNPDEDDGAGAQETEKEKPIRLTGPVQFVLKLMEYWRLEIDDAVVLLGFDRSDVDYVHSVLEGREQFRGKDVRDRISHLYGIRKSLRFLFRDLETENAWLREPHEELKGKSPMELLLSGSMERLLVVKDYVDTFAGR